MQNCGRALPNNNICVYLQSQYQTAPKTHGEWFPPTNIAWSYNDFTLTHVSFSKSILNKPNSNVLYGQTKGSAALSVSKPPSCNTLRSSSTNSPMRLTTSKTLPDVPPSKVWRCKDNSKHLALATLMHSRKASI